MILFITNEFRTQLLQEHRYESSNVSLWTIAHSLPEWVKRSALKYNTISVPNNEYSHLTPEIHGYFDALSLIHGIIGEHALV